eukprot:c8463_g1_i1 orf=275-571(-)
MELFFWACDTRGKNMARIVGMPARNITNIHIFKYSSSGNNSIHGLWIRQLINTIKKAIILLLWPSVSKFLREPFERCVHGYKAKRVLEDENHTLCGRN